MEANQTLKATWRNSNKTELNSSQKHAISIANMQESFNYIFGYFIHSEKSIITIFHL